MSTVFSESLAKLRQSKGVSQRTAASDLGVSQALLSHYENGIREPGLEFVSRACDYYCVSSDYLLGRSGAKTETAGVPIRTEANSTEFEIPKLAEIDLRLFSDSISLLSKVVADSGNRKLMNDSFAYFALTIYKYMQHVTDKDEVMTEITVPDPYLGAETAMKLAELEILGELKRMGGIRVEALDERFPDTYNSLVQVLYNAGLRIKRL